MRRDRVLSLTTSVGSRPTLKLTAGPRTLELSAGSDYEGGSCATAKLTHTVGPYAERSYGWHAANGNHAEWVWIGVRREWRIRRWRIGWFWA